MTAFNFRSLLLAAIILSNCITWTASRHHYAHNVHQHRTRHRRQGAGLYLPASYIIPGGEGSGPWGEWGEVSPCSRTCGGGVASQKRICLQPGPEGQLLCTGGDTKYFSCQTQDCPEGFSDFRAEQCAEFNDVDFRGFKYDWEPYTNAPNPCELNCMPHGERFYFRHKLQVIDGTRCNDESFDVCVNGICQPVGCDMMLNSNAREDKCRECRGNGANCRTTKGNYNSQDAVRGYNDILLIPAGSTTIYIEELEPSNNYLALRAKNGTYYLNGHYRIDFPRTLIIAGAPWTYERSQHGFEAPDKLRCPGPTNEDLYLSLLLQGKNVGIRYEYSVPNNTAPPTDKRYSWVHEEFTPCSATCGGGFQTRNVTCRSREELEVVEDNLCNEGLRPPTNQSCSPDPCPAQWVEGPWGECSQRCGLGGVKSREVTCQKIITNGIQSIVPDKECFDLLGPKPKLFQKCNEDAPCPKWFVGHWKPCDKLCDEGKQTRQVVCYQKKDGRIEVLDEKDCTEQKPEVEKPCMLQPCEAVDWVVTAWSGCDSCTSKNRTRLVVCSTKSQQLVNDSFCSYHNRPVDFEECKKDKLPSCEVQWYASQWGKCSATCGDGVQVRKVFCGMYYDDASGEGVEVVDDARCANLTKYTDTKPCTVPKEECPSQWFAGPWEACTEKCGGGEQSRRVMCFQGLKEPPNCDGTKVLESTQVCNTGPCDKDQTLPVSRTSTVIMDEDEDSLPECDDEDYEEVGLDLLTTNLMMSDSTGFAEHETTLESETDESSLSTEGSGFTTLDIDYTTDDYTYSGDTSTTEEPDSTTQLKDKDSSTTTTTVLPPVVSDETATGSTPTVDNMYTSSDNGSTNSAEPTTVEETEITKSTAFKELESTSESDSKSSDTAGTGSTTEARTGSTESSLSTETKEIGSDKTESTVSGGTDETTSTGETKSTVTESTGPTISTITEKTPSTESTVTDTSSPTESSITESAGSTESTVAEATDKTESTESSSTDETTSTKETGSTVTESTGPTISAITEITPSTETTVTDISSPTESTITDKTESTESSSTDETTSTEETESTVTESSGPTISTITEKTPSTESTVRDTSSPTESTITDKTESTGSSSTDETTSTEKTESTVTESTSPTISTITEETSSTESTVTDTSSPTESTITESAGSTQSTVAEATDKTESTESTVTNETGSTNTTGSEETESTESTDTEKTESTESTIESTELTVTDANNTTITSESDSTGTTNTKETSDTDETSSGSTDSTTTTRAVPTGSTTTTVAVPTESKSSTEESSTPISTESSGTSEYSTDSSETTIETGSSTIESSTTSESDETTEASSTISSISTTEGTESSSLGAETSTSSETESTTAAIESSSLASGSTEAGSSTLSESESTSETTESGSTSRSVSTTEGSESSTEASSTVSGEITTGSSTEESSTASEITTESSTEESSTASEITTESSTEESSTASEITTGTPTEESSTASGSTTESTGSEESTIYSTTEGTTMEGSTTESESTELSTTEGSSGTTIWTKTTIFVPGPPLCRPRRKPKCSKTKFGCCPDRKTEALGPFDDGCPERPRTCQTSTYGCCPDGLSPAKGDNNEGCPVEPCADTLFGCCSSDNKTAAQGNDQEGCPPPPPPCVSSEFGCCADNETEATGPEKEGCPETETTSTEAPTETTTETTESTETSEGSTTSELSTTDEGTTDVGTTTLDPCSGFQFGCCADNETEASGPDGQGCPCNATEFGCCPDGVIPASGPDNEGCPGSCSTTPHGCCQDGKTPAHGPEFEGCCLLAAFGCCPDNRKPAEGPHVEGCGCQYTLYGCCPDNVTIAQGPGNLGCGCQYTQYGCCLDRHTPALGPNNEGCACNTYQFGCCADGVTIAKGPDQQGCHCRDSKFGCCGDGETPATGPDAAGCDCSSSQHGCCPDGRTEAAGPKFLGCTDAPENKQAACSLSTDPGPCHNFTAMWYYDVEYGGCSRFWYGGCEGNGNRFSTKADCEDVCVQPSPKDACKLPSVKGACDGDYARWHYNSTREQCIPFRYGGCLGNANNFDTRELCQKQCEPSSIAAQCDLPIDQGSCAGNYSRWGFNPEAQLCEQFIWGGCEGNSNRFSSEAACQMRCAGTTPPQCTQPQQAGNCDGKEALWSFSPSEDRCLPFYYSGCGGNDNRFGSREACEQTCPSAYVPDKCTLPAATGECSNYREKWFYDTTYKRCRQFYYGGCGGNENNFATEVECENSCSEIKSTTTTTTTTATSTTARPVETEPPPQRPDEPGPSTPERQEFCFYTIDAGPCKDKIETRYAYDSRLGRCVTFQYGGCGGNQNNFPEERYCTYYCQPIQDICQLPMLQGPCDESQMRWFYDSSTDSCSQFTYGGCGGNDNSFESLEACENRCRTGPAPVAPTTPTTTVAASEPPECRVPESLEKCHYGGLVWYFEPNQHVCVSHSNQESGVNCRYTGTFFSEEACQRSCGAFRGVDVCKQPLDAGPCTDYVTKVHFDQSIRQCREFAYGGCLGGANRFSSMEECSQVCKAEIDVCSLPPDQGSCNLRVVQWYYDPSYDQCFQFAYYGCSGNDNRFETQRDCEARCKRPGSTTTTVVPPPQSAQPECKTPSSLVPCGNNVTVFYYDSERGQCFASGFGGCEHPNSYSTEEECERKCGAFRGIDVCGARLDPGSCRASIPKFYWDAMSGSCQSYAYGGCDGGPNRFSTFEECMDICGDTGLDSNQVLPVDCTPYQQECEALVCPYGVDRFTQDGCQKCVCKEDPCLRTNCQPTERCVAVEMRNPASQELEYTATCENNEVDQCDEYDAYCSRLRCDYVIQRVRQPNGCDQCSCVQVEIDCEPLKQECTQLKCNYGIEKVTGPDGCERCKCKEYPCERVSCAAGERCIVNQYRNVLDPEPQFTAECRTVVKAGACPMDETTTNEVSCRRECVDDADCRGVGKCCRRGCSNICLVPVEQTSPHPLLTTTDDPNKPAAPLALPQPEPEVAASEGGKATLRCLFHGNPPPTITWKFGELTIDGNAGRYRLMSDGSLDIVSLYRNDTGVYICVADNGIGVATQEIHLVVNDPVIAPAGIAGDENAVVTGELGQPLHVRCLAYGYPPPAIYWYHGYDGTMVPFHDAVYEARGDVLLIRNLAVETLGQYTCQAYNGEGKAASWVVFVRAYMPEGIFIENEYLVPRNTLPPRLRTQPPTSAETSTTITTSTTTEAPRLFTVPVSAHVSTPFATLNIGAELRLTCEIDGFPEPNAYWTKDGVNIQPDGDRISITGSTIVSRLLVARVTVSDSGLYACHASNSYSSQSDTAQINVQQLIIPAKCTDNPFFANCDLIVRSKFCRHQYYGKFCCKSCVEAGQLDPQEAALQADQPLKKK